MGELMDGDIVPTSHVMYDWLKKNEFDGNAPDEHWSFDSQTGIHEIIVDEVTSKDDKASQARKVMIAEFGSLSEQNHVQNLNKVDKGSKLVITQDNTSNPAAKKRKTDDPDVVALMLKRVPELKAKYPDLAFNVSGVLTNKHDTKVEVYSIEEARETLAVFASIFVQSMHCSTCMAQRLALPMVTQSLTQAGLAISEKRQSQFELAKLSFKASILDKNGAMKLFLHQFEFQNKSVSKTSRFGIRSASDTMIQIIHRFASVEVCEKMTRDEEKQGIDQFM